MSGDERPVLSGIGDAASDYSKDPQRDFRVGLTWQILVLFVEQLPTVQPKNLREVN